jgi:uncharacterized protein YegP (UPF0339 family)
MGYYTLFQSKKSGEWYFNLKAGNHEIILASEGYAEKAGAQHGIASVQVNAGIEARYLRKESAAGWWFTLTAANSQVIGRSEMYSSAAARDKGIESVKHNGAATDIRATEA